MGKQGETISHWLARTGA